MNEYTVIKPEHTSKIYATKHETKFADMVWSIESLILECCHNCRINNNTGCCF